MIQTRQYESAVKEAGFPNLNIGDTRIHDIIHLTEESSVLEAVTKIEKALVERMQLSADNPDQKSFIEKMAALGFGDRP